MPDSFAHALASLRSVRHRPELGIDEVLTTSNYGQDEQMTLDMMSRFAEEVMPHFRQRRKAA